MGPLGYFLMTKSMKPRESRGSGGCYSGLERKWGEGDGEIWESYEPSSLVGVYGRIAGFSISGPLYLVSRAAADGCQFMSRNRRSLVKRTSYL